MRIRTARVGDVDLLTEIAHQAKQYWGYPDDWMRQWSGALTFDGGALSTMKVFVAEDEGGVLGFYALAGGGATVDLEHLWVRPRAMGRGVGRSLVEHAVATAAAGGADVVAIEADPYAEPFYRRVGAVRVGESPAPMPGAPDRVLPVLHIAVSRRLDRDPGER